jgi:shikimate kinase
MGCGKTTLGRQLAELLHRPFIDLDEAVEEHAGMPVYKIFQSKGEGAFRVLEKEVLHKVIRQSEPMIVALGGGTACDEENLNTIKQNGLLVYIRIPTLTLAERLEPHTAQRPLLAGLSGGQLVESIEQRLLEREKYYERAHLSVNGINLGAPQLLRYIQGVIRSGNI